MSGFCSAHRHHEPGCERCEMLPAFMGDTAPLPVGGGVLSSEPKADALERRVRELERRVTDLEGGPPS